MTLAATIDLLGESNRSRRGAARVRVGMASTLRDPAGAPNDVLVEDLSETGFRFFSVQHLPVGTAVRLGLAGAGTAAARVVRRQGDEHGCAFDTPLSSQQVTSAFTAADVVHVTASEGAAAIDDHDPWPGIVRLAIFVGGGLAAWALAFALIKLAG